MRDALSTRNTQIVEYQTNQSMTTEKPIDLCTHSNSIYSNPKKNDQGQRPFSTNRTEIKDTSYQVEVKNQKENEVQHSDKKNNYAPIQLFNLNINDLTQQPKEHVPRHWKNIKPRPTIGRISQESQQSQRIIKE